MKKGETKSKKLCVLYNCYNVRKLGKLLCYNHFQIKDKLYSYRYKYGDLIKEKGNVKKPLLQIDRL